MIGVLHQIWRQGYLDADFMPEADRAMAALLRQPRPRRADERPEFGDGDTASIDQQSVAQEVDKPGVMPGTTEEDEPQAR